MSSPGARAFAMQVQVELIQARRTETLDLPSEATALDLLRQLHLAPDAHLVIRGDAPIPIDTRLVDGEELRILSAISGGT